MAHAEALPRSQSRETSAKAAMCRPPPKPRDDDATDDTEATHQSKRSRTKSLADQPPTPCELNRRAGNDEARVEKIAGAVSTILEALGEDRTRPGLQQTPKRLAQLLVDCTSGYARRLDEVLNGAVFEETCSKWLWWDIALYSASASTTSCPSTANATSPTCPTAAF